jgi:hypothetical protein
MSRMPSLHETDPRSVASPLLRKCLDPILDMCMDPVARRSVAEGSQSSRLDELTTHPSPIFIPSGAAVRHEGLHCFACAPQGTGEGARPYGETSMMDAR